MLLFVLKISNHVLNLKHLKYYVEVLYHMIEWGGGGGGGGGGGYSISDNLKMTDVMYIFVHLFLWQNKVEILDKWFVLFLLNAMCLAEILQIPIV